MLFSYHFWNLNISCKETLFLVFKKKGQFVTYRMEQIQ